LTYLHASSFWHQDLRPDCIGFIYERGRPVVKLLDFGLARRWDEEMRGQLEVDVRELVYQPLEALFKLTTDNYHKTRDIWSAGVILGELITHKLLFYRKERAPTKTSVTISMFKLLGPPPLSFCAEFVNADREQLEKYVARQDVPQFNNIFGPEIFSIPNDPRNDAARALVKSLLKLNAAERPSAESVLRHPYIAHHHQSDVKSKPLAKDVVDSVSSFNTDDEQQLRELLLKELQDCRGDEEGLETKRMRSGISD